MTKQRLTVTFAFLCVLTCLFSGELPAQGTDAEPLPPPNPLVRMVNGLNPANWTMPKLKMPTMSTFLPTSEEKERVITKKDGLVSEVSSTAKKSWTRTKQALNPMRLIPAGFRQNSESKPATGKKPGFFSSLFAPYPPEESEPAQSVTDWLKQEPVR